MRLWDQSPPETNALIRQGCEQLTHWKSSWCWEILRAEGEEGIRSWDVWMASPMQWTWTLANLGDDEGHRGLECFIPWGCKELDTTGWLNNNIRWGSLLSTTGGHQTPDLPAPWVWLPSLQNYENKCLSVSYIWLWYLVIGAWAD